MISTDAGTFVEGAGAKATLDDSEVEMRIALAMSGAIALVLYESGVAHEIHSFNKPNGPYAAALKLARMKPVVDILTGASAGGINSIFLGHCFVTGSDFEDFARVWIEMAGVDILRYGVGEEPASVLNAEILKTRMAEIFAEHLEKAPPLKADDELDEEIKVRLCRTDLRGFCVSTVDAAGHRIDVQSRSDVLAFGNNAFKNRNTKEIIDAAAATSAFPVVFPAVFDNGRWYVDGGLWDNQPIDLAIEAIQDKPAFKRTRRCVFFIDPEPSILSDEDNVELPVEERIKIQIRQARKQEQLRPSMVETAAFIPGSGVKGNVLPALESALDYNRRVDLYNQALSLPVLGDNVETIADQMQATNPTATTPIHQRSLLTQARINNVLFDNDPKLIQTWLMLQERLKDKFEVLAKEAANVLALLNDVDIYRRAVRRELKNLNERLQNPLSKEQLSEELSRKENLYKFLKVANDFLEVPSSQVNDFVGRSLAYREHRRERVSRFWPASVRMLSQLWAEVSDIDAKGSEKPDRYDAAIKKAIFRWRRALTDSPESDVEPKPGEEKSFTHSSPIDIADEDIVRYVLASFSDLDNKGQIDIVRISPNDADNLHLIGSPKARLGQTPAAQKLAGEGLGHISGFLEERWRRNDYVWGRLDAAEILLRTLFTYAERDADARGIPLKFTKTEHKNVLKNIQTQILQAEAERYQGREGKGTNPSAKVQYQKCAAVDKLPPKEKPGKADQEHIDENKKIIGFGQEDLGDAIEPQFSKNVEYITQTFVRALRGSSSKTPAALDRLGRMSRLMSYIAIAFTWILPLKPNTARAVWIRAGAVTTIFFLVFAWGWLLGGKHDPMQTITLVGEGLVALIVLIGLGAGLGSSLRLMVPLTAVAGTALGFMLACNAFVALNEPVSIGKWTMSPFTLNLYVFTAVCGLLALMVATVVARWIVGGISALVLRYRAKQGGKPDSQRLDGNLV